jgi:aminoglycoside phosphotransferase (APT) family kinase protein
VIKKMNPSLKSKFETEIGKITAIKQMPEQGCTSEVHLIETPEHYYILKSSFKDKYRAWLKSEAEVLRDGRYGNIPLPAFHAFFEEKGASHLIMSYVDGISLTSALKNACSETENKKLITSFGEFLNRLHEAGPFSPEKEHSWLENQLVLARNYLDSGQSEGDMNLLERMIAHKPDPVHQTIIHGDCTTDNVLVVDGKVGVFIDVAGMTFGDPRYDEALAIREFLDHPDYMEAFYQGYTRHRITKEEYEYFEEGLYMFF